MYKKIPRFVKILTIIVITILLIFIFSPFYLRQGLIHLFPNLDDYKIFHNNIVTTTESPEPWKISSEKRSLSDEDKEYLTAHETTAFLVIQNGEILYENYWKDTNEATPSNTFSVTKSIVSLLVGIALDEGNIQSLNEPIGKYIPEFSNDERGRITILDLLTMSSGLDWDEQYSSPFSITTKAYYGNNLREIVTSQKLVTEPGKVFKYLSGNTQLLAYIVEKAAGKTISEYAQEKIWKSIGAEHQAIWSKDATDGDERAFCCFHTNARDIARIGQLVLNKGKWNGKQIVSEDYITKATAPADFLIDEKGKNLNYYGYQWWILNEAGYKVPYMRGHKGQYIYSIPEKNAVVVRLGEKKDKEKIGPITADIIKYFHVGLGFLK